MWVEPHDNNAPILGYYVSYNQPDFATGEMMIVNTIGTMANITELYPGVTYNFTITAFNEVGNSSSSTVISFRTLEESKSLQYLIVFLLLFIPTTHLSLVPSSFPQNVNVSVNSSTILLVTWEEISGLDQNGIITIYEVLYDPVETFDGMLVPQTVNTTVLFAYLTELQQNVDYFISVRAYTSIGSGPYSEEISARTLEDSK
jgi:hypothetical protein